MRKDCSEKSEAVLHEGRFLTFIDKGGWEYVKRCNCSGIVIIVSKTDEGKVILVEQFRPPVNKRVIEFPAGLVNDGDPASSESLEKAALRELYEETGYRAETAEVLLHGPVSSGSSADLVTMVLAKGLEKSGKGGGDETENIIVHEIEMAKVHDWLANMNDAGFLIEPKIYAGLYFLQRNK